MSSENDKGRVVRSNKDDFSQSSPEDEPSTTESQSPPKTSNLFKQINRREVSKGTYVAIGAAAGAVGGGMMGVQRELKRFVADIESKNPHRRFDTLIQRLKGDGYYSSLTTNEMRSFLGGVTPVIREALSRREAVTVHYPNLRAGVELQKFIALKSKDNNVSAIFTANLYPKGSKMADFIEATWLERNGKTGKIIFYDRNVNASEATRTPADSSPFITAWDEGQSSEINYPMQVIVPSMRPDLERTLLKLKDGQVEANLNQKTLQFLQGKSAAKKL